MHMFESPGVEIRLAFPDDAGDILAWRNDPHSRAMFFDGASVGVEEHLAWYSSALKNPALVMYIGTSEAGKIGVCRFERVGGPGLSEVSINLNPSLRGRKLASGFLAGCLALYGQHRSDTLVARIKPENAASRRIFEANGFRLACREPECDRFTREMPPPPASPVPVL